MSVTCFLDTYFIMVSTPLMFDVNARFDESVQPESFESLVSVLEELKEGEKMRYLKAFIKRKSVALILDCRFPKSKCDHQTIFL